MPATSFRLLDVNVLLDDPRVRHDRVQSHPHHELVYIVGGKYRVETMGVTWPGGPGWLFCYQPAQRHRPIYRAGHFEAILVQWTEPAGRRAVYPPAYYDASRRWYHMLNWLLDLFTSTTQEDRQAAGELLPVLLRELTRSAERSQSLVPAVNVYISDHLTDPIRGRDLAAAAGLSRSHFSRHFRRLTGQSPQEYVSRSRLERARALLPNQTLSLAEIARQCGFSSPSHLSRLYRQHFKIQPSRDRK
jgi:AraC-like DNA-binding protein